MLARAHQFGHLADMPEIVHGPLMQHLLERDLAGRLVPGSPFAGATRQRPQELDVSLALLLEVIERIFGIGIAIEIEIHLRIVRFELRQIFAQESIDAHAIAVAFGVRQVRQHFGDRETVGRRFPVGILVGKLAHQPAENHGRLFEQVQAIESVIFHHALYPTIFSPPST